MVANSHVNLCLAFDVPPSVQCKRSRPMKWGRASAGVCSRLAVRKEPGRVEQERAPSGPRPPCRVEGPGRWTPSAMEPRVRERATPAASTLFR